MADPKSSHRPRRRFYIHNIQRKYAALTFLLLMAYTFVLAVALFLPPAMKLMAGGPLEEQVRAASQFLALSDRLWPAILVSVPVFMILSVFVTHRFAGPVYRLEQSLKRMAAGDFDLHVRFRPGDDLQELAVLLNQIIYREGEVFRTVETVHQHLQISMAEMKRSYQAAPGHLAPMLDEIQIQIEQLEAILRRFKASHSSSEQLSGDKPPSTDA